ncbi:hypothetical protein QL285_021326 [Trifolium repens]|nr:hypothetical protein QL285_021326 [Trifolium repens]
MDARGANTFPSHNQLPNLNQGFRDIFLSPHGINKRRWRLHCMKNGSDFPARYTPEYAQHVLENQDNFQRRLDEHSSMLAAIMETLQSINARLPQQPDQP